MATDLQISMEKPAAWTRRLTITIPAARLEQERQSVVQRLAKSARLPGFRKGKVPSQVINKRFGAAIEQEAVEHAISAAYRHALEQEGLKPITEGSIGNVDYQPGSDLTFRVELEVRPELELERLGGFQVTRPAPAVTDGQVAEVLDRLREERTHYHAVNDRLALDRDLVDVEITPLDEATEGATASPRRYQIVIGAGEAVAAIEDVLRRLRPGEAGEYELQLPADADDPAAGTRAHRVHIRMLEVKEPHQVALDDEFARSLGQFEGLDDLRAKVREDLAREGERGAEREVRGRLLHEIIRANPFEVPSSMVRQYAEALVPARQGLSEERLAELRQSMWPAAEEALQRLLVIERVAELEGLHATSAEVEERVAGIAERVGHPAPEIAAQLRKNGRLDEIEREITEEKVFEYLKSLSTIE